MLARSIYLLPTLSSFSRTQSQEDVLALFAHLRDAIRAGLPLAFGTDAGVIPHGRNAREFESLRELGLEPLEAIRMATVHAAAAVGLADSIGVLEAGASADVIAVDGDPLQDRSALQRHFCDEPRGNHQTPVRAVITTADQIARIENWRLPRPITFSISAHPPELCNFQPANTVSVAIDTLTF